MPSADSGTAFSETANNERILFTSESVGEGHPGKRDIHMGYQIKSFNSADIVKLFSAENLSKSAKLVGCEAVITFGEIIFKSLDSRL